MWTWVIRIPQATLAAGQVIFSFARRELEVIVNALVTWLINAFALAFIGYVIAWLSFLGADDPPGKLGRFGIDLGQGLIAFAGFMAAVVLIFLLLRIGLLATLAVGINRLAHGVVREISRPLPGPPVNFPQLITADDASRILHWIAGGYAALFGAALYASFFPVYKNPGWFLVVLLAIFFLATASYAWGLASTMPLKEMAVWAAAAIIVIATVVFILPTFFRDQYAYFQQRATDRINTLESLERTDREAHRSVVEEERRDLIALENIKKAILASHRLHGKLQPNEVELLNKTEKAIDAIRADNPSAIPAEESAPASFPTAHVIRTTNGSPAIILPNLNWGRIFWVILLLIAIFLFGRWLAKNSSGGHGHGH